MVTVVRNKYTCAEPGQEEIKRAIAADKLDRVVVASCSPRMHEPTFRGCVADVGLNPYLMEMANLREHARWVHSHDPEAATGKAKDLVQRRCAAQRADAAERDGRPGHQALARHRRRRGRHPGGARPGRLGATRCILVEKEPSIGGIMAQLDKTFPTMDCSI